VSAAVLGPLQVTVADRVLGPRDWGGRKPKQVLEILLVHQGQPAPKERIAELLWGPRPPRDPMRTLEAYVSGLRARLGPGPARKVLCTVPSGYRLDSDPLDLDLHRFDDLVSQAGAAAPGPHRMQQRSATLALVRGELLADEPYAEWVLPLRELYAERVLQLRLDLAEDLLAAGNPDQAVRQAEQVLAVQPGRERAHRLLVAARYAAGEPDLALRAYHRCRQILDTELGVPPLAETEQVYLAVLRQAPVAAVLPATRPTVTVPPRPPQTRFARNRDATIAYQVLGDGPLDVIFAHAWFSHMEIGWEEPRYAAFLRRLASRRRLIIFDRRGMGMSDPAPPTVGLRERAEDIRAVMDAAGSGQAIVFGSCGSGPTAIALAATAPRRVRGLVLFGTFARMLAAPGYQFGWTTGRGLRRSVPSAGPDEALMEWLSRLLRLSASPAEARALLDFGATLDVRDVLDRITCPTLVLHRRDDQWVHPDNARYLATHIPDARLIELDGADHWPWFGDTDSIMRPLEEFLGRLTPAAAGRFSEGRGATLPS
jgi:DNA-binding SARP family transcriptional activator/pimeloyl-ACP methyl ester carboxylesterase